MRAGPLKITNTNRSMNPLLLVNACWPKRGVFDHDDMPNPCHQRSNLTMPHSSVNWHLHCCCEVHCSALEVHLCTDFFTTSLSVLFEHTLPKLYLFNLGHTGFIEHQMHTLNTLEAHLSSCTFFISEHITLADIFIMWRLAKGAGVEPGSTYISQVWKLLPLLIKEKVSGSYTTWVFFLGAVQTINIKFIKDRANMLRKDVEKQWALRTQVQWLKSTPESPTGGIHHDMAWTSLSDTPSGLNTLKTTQTTTDNPYVGITGGQENLFIGQQPYTLWSPPGPVTLQSQAELHAQIASIPHHPTTDAGCAVHKAQQLTWVAQHGANGWVTEMTPYPLRPGTAPINSGKCFNCGIIGHIGSHCMVPLDKCLHRNKQVWRVICTNVFREPTGIWLVLTSDYGMVKEVEDVGGDFYGLYRQGNGSRLLE